MGFFDSLKEQGQKFADKAKEEVQNQQKKVADIKEERGKNLEKISKIKYFGGFNDEKPYTGTLEFYEKVTEFNSFSKPRAMVIKNSDIKDIAIEGKAEVSRRVTVTRLLAVGIFAFALKKKSEDKESFITLVLKDGREVVFHSDELAPTTMKQKLSNTVSRVRNQNLNQSTTIATADYTEELKKLSELKDNNIITQEEFEQKKKQVLGL